MLFGVPLALGSYWGLLAFVAIALVIVWRLIDEGKFLKQNLPVRSSIAKNCDIGSCIEHSCRSVNRFLHRPLALGRQANPKNLSALCAPLYFAFSPRSRLFNPDLNAPVLLSALHVVAPVGICVWGNRLRFTEAAGRNDRFRNAFLFYQPVLHRFRAPF